VTVRENSARKGEGDSGNGQTWPRKELLIAIIDLPKFGQQYIWPTTWLGDYVRCLYSKQAVIRGIPTASRGRIPRGMSSYLGLGTSLPQFIPNKHRIFIGTSSILETKLPRQTTSAPLGRSRTVRGTPQFAQSLDLYDFEGLIRTNTQEVFLA
jgi:hypothetical protein